MLTIEFAGTRRVIGVGVVPAQKLKSLFCGSALSGSKVV